MGQPSPSLLERYRARMQASKRRAAQRLAEARDMEQRRLAGAQDAGGRIRRGYLQSVGICDAPAGTRRTPGRSPQATAEAAHPELEARGLEGEEPAKQDNFRLNFLRKLAYGDVWVPPVRQPPRSQTVIIFDWDDTLLCTSWIQEQLTTLGASVLRDVSIAARQLLELACSMGRTFIITNAMSGWVEQSAAKWAPEIVPALSRLNVISARSRWEAAFPLDIREWKVQAFREVRRKLDSQVITNLLSVGDSEFEMEAAHVMGGEFDEALIKTVRLRSRPGPGELLQELRMVADKFGRIVESGGHLRICLEPKPRR